jgi:hypothetical protein
MSFLISEKDERSRSFLKKRTKKLLSRRASAPAIATRKQRDGSLFASFSSEKEGLF